MASPRADSPLRHYRSPPSRPAKPPAPANDPFGEEVTLTPKTIIYLKGNSTWDQALDNLVDAFKSVNALSRQAGHQAGPGPR